MYDSRRNETNDIWKCFITYSSDCVNSGDTVPVNAKYKIIGFLAAKQVLRCYCTLVRKYSIKFKQDQRGDCAP